MADNISNSENTADKKSPISDPLISGILLLTLQEERSRVAEAINQAKSSTLTYMPYAETLKQPNLAKSNAHNIATITCLDEPIISFQQYLQVRQTQIKEFADMKKWCHNKATVLQEVLKKEDITAELHESFIEFYQSKYYSSQASGQQIKDTATIAMADRQDSKNQILQLYALMDLFDNIDMQNTKEGFTIDTLAEGRGKINLITGIYKDNKLTMFCNSDVLNDPEHIKLGEKALCLMIEQTRRLCARNYKQHDDSFPIDGNANPELLLRLYQTALIQNLNPIIEQNCIDHIIKYDQENDTPYGYILAHLIVIKTQAGKTLAASENAFVEQQKVLDKEGNLSRAITNIAEQTQQHKNVDYQGFLIRRLQEYDLSAMEKKLTCKYGEHIISTAPDLKGKINPLETTTCHAIDKTRNP